MPLSTSPRLDPKVNAVIAELVAARRYPGDGGPRANPASRDPHAYAAYGFSIFPEQGELIYLLCRAQRATRVAEFATSLGMSTLYLAAALRDNGGGDSPSLAREVMEIVAPQIRLGGLVMNDNGEEDSLAFVRDPAYGFRSMLLPLKGGTELSVKVA